VLDGGVGGERGREELKAQLVPLMAVEPGTTKTYEAVVPGSTACRPGTQPNRV